MPQIKRQFNVFPYVCCLFGEQRGKNKKFSNTIPQNLKQLANFVTIYFFPTFAAENTISLNLSLIQKFNIKNVTDTFYPYRPGPIHHPDCVLLEAV